MIALRTFSLLAKSIKSQTVISAAFSSENWKDRDDAAEKVYITRA
jgi:hypothetical protein